MILMLEPTVGNYYGWHLSEKQWDYIVQKSDQKVWFICKSLLSEVETISWENYFSGSQVFGLS